MKKNIEYLIFIVVIFFFLFINGCNEPSLNVENSNKANVQPTTSNANKNVEANNEQIGILDKEFTPKNFNITKFELHCDSPEYDIQILVRYNISENLYNLLEKGHKYYFSVEFPQQISEITGVAISDRQEGPVVRDRKLSYEVTFIQTTSRLSPEQVNLINTNQDGYNLLISDEANFVFQQHMNIKYAPQVKEGESDILYFEKTIDLTKEMAEDK